MLTGNPRFQKNKTSKNKKNKYKRLLLVVTLSLNLQVGRQDQGFGFCPSILLHQLQERELLFGQRAREQQSHSWLWGVIWTAG